MSFSSRRRNYMLVSHRRDMLIEFIKGLLQHSFVLDALEESASNSWHHVEEMIEEHRERPLGSRLATAVPTIGSFWTSLPLEEAWKVYDERFRVSRRRFVSPSFDEIREILNSAQILAFRAPERACGHSLDFVSFDGDCTLYSDGKNFNDDLLAGQIADLLRAGVIVALVTAAGYGYECGKYERRLEGLLRVLDGLALPVETLRRFYVVGGECNYLLQLTRVYDKSLEGPGRVALQSRAEVWGVKFDELDVSALLDVAERTLQEAVSEMQLREARVYRKPRAVGLVPAEPRREQLDEAVLRVQSALRTADPKVSYCAFNGGADVWVDVGNKEVGVSGLQRLFSLESKNCLHIGDQFLNTGNDHAARGCTCCLWITKPMETKMVLADILKVVDPAGQAARDEHALLPKPESP